MPAAAGKSHPAVNSKPAAQKLAATTSASSSKAEAADNEPSDAELWKERGNKAFKAGDYTRAKTCYTQSIALEPTCIAYANRAQASIKLEDFSAAEQDCTQALKLDSSYVKAWHRRATARKAVGQLLEALDDYEMAVR